MTCRQAKQLLSYGNFLSVDVEWCEHDHSKVLEVGITTYSSIFHSLECEHFIIKENLRYKNGRHVPNNRDNFRFGQSVTTSLKNVIDILNSYLWDGEYLWHLVGHGISSDLHVLQLFGLQLPDEGEVFDTASLFKNSDKYQGEVKSNLEYICCRLGMKPKKDSLHNAGNDAYYTMKAFLKLVR